MAKRICSFRSYALNIVLYQNENVKKKRGEEMETLARQNKINDVSIAWKIVVTTCVDKKKHNITGLLLNRYPELRGKVSKMVRVLAAEERLVK